eukprot:1107777-Prorocentrum_minimum.AAC.2
MATAGKSWKRPRRWSASRLAKKMLTVARRAQMCWRRCLARLWSASSTHNANMRFTCPGSGP